MVADWIDGRSLGMRSEYFGTWLTRGNVYVSRWSSQAIWDVDIDGVDGIIDVVEHEAVDNVVGGDVTVDNVVGGDVVVDKIGGDDFLVDNVVGVKSLLIMLLLVILLSILSLLMMLLIMMLLLLIILLWLMLMMLLLMMMIIIIMELLMDIEKESSMQYAIIKILNLELCALFMEWSGMR